MRMGNDADESKAALESAWRSFRDARAKRSTLRALAATIRAENPPEEYGNGHAPPARAG